MRYGIISCVHGNLPALEAVLRDAREQRCDSILCLGDLVDYFDNPKECIQLVRSACAACVKGNHDELCSTDFSCEGFTETASENIQRTRAQLSLVEKEYLAGLPYVVAIDDFTLVHATLAEPHKWGYVFEKTAAAEHFIHQETRLCFAGHTHVPAAFVWRAGDVRGGTYGTMKLERGARYLINVGSVGQPRDGNPKAAFVVYDRDAQTIELRRVDYDRPPGGDSGSAKPSNGSGPLRSLGASAKPDAGRSPQ